MVFPWACPPVWDTCHKVAGFSGYTVFSAKSSCLEDYLKSIVLCEKSHPLSISHGQHMSGDKTTVGCLCADRLWSSPSQCLMQNLPGKVWVTLFTCKLLRQRVAAMLMEVLLLRMHLNSAPQSYLGSEVLFLKRFLPLSSVVLPSGEETWYLLLFLEFHLLESWEYCRLQLLVHERYISSSDRWRKSRKSL